MTEHEAFLNAVMERPDDDLPRLVYADYLEETGDAVRAEFIRVQIERAQLQEGDDRFEILLRREMELLGQGVGGSVPGVRGKQTFRRGFVEVLHTTAERLIAASQPVLLLAPIRELRISNADNSIAELARVPGLDRIRTLDLRNNTFGTRDRLAHFFDAAPLRSMTDLAMKNNQLWSDDVEKLVDCRWASQLRSLDLSGNAIGDAGMGVLADAERLSELRRLSVRSDELDWRDRITSYGAEELANSPGLHSLHTLDISGHLIRDWGIADLASPSGLPNIRRIDASSNGVEFDSDFERLFRTPPRERMRAWILSGSRIGMRAAEGFAVWDQLATLDELILERCEWAPGARELLAGSACAYKIRMGDPVAGELA